MRCTKSQRASAKSVSLDYLIMIFIFGENNIVHVTSISHTKLCEDSARERVPGGNGIPLRSRPPARRTRSARTIYAIPAKPWRKKLGLQAFIGAQ